MYFYFFAEFPLESSDLYASYTYMRVYAVTNVCEKCGWHESHYSLHNIQEDFSCNAGQNRVEVAILITCKTQNI